MKISLIYFSLILMNSLFAQSSINIDRIDTTWWYDNYSSGLVYLDNNDLDAAEEEFSKILDIDEKIAHAYYGLGRVYDTIEKGNEEDEENYELAIELDPDLIDAYYFLGLLYEHNGSGSSSKDCFETVIEKNPHNVNGWIALARVEEKSKKPWEMPIDSYPAEILANALEVNPADKKLYEQYKNFIFWYSYEKISIPTFNYLIQQNPSISGYAIDFAQVLYNLEMYESSLNQIESIESLSSNYSLVKINLLRSKILFNTDKEDKGLDYYWQAINAISDSLDANEIYSDISYIMNDSEFEEYQTTSIADLPDFYARFWLSRDPNLATKVNERIAEHFIRLKYAWKNYRRFVPGYYDKFVINNFEHPLYGVMDMKFGDELLNPFVSNALPGKKDLDDRGLIYLRHGEPDNFAYYNCMACPQNVSWKYYASPFRPELIFHFSKHSDVRGWFLESLPYSFSERGDFGGHYAQLDPANFQNQDNLGGDLWMYEELNDENIENVKVGLKTETTEYVYENTLFEFPLEYLCFKGENFKTKINLFYGIEGSNMQIDTSKQRNRLDYTTFVGFFDKRWNEVVRFVDNIIVPLKITQDEWDSSSIIDTESFSVRPGVYNFELQLQDKVANNLGVYKSPLTIPNYWKNELMLSDIFLSGPVARNNERANFKIGDIQLSPHMFSAYNKRETVGLYFEIYNLFYDSDDRTKFEVTWWIGVAGDEETDTDAVKSSLEYSGETRDDKIYFNIELSDTDSGDYELAILVKDIISEKEVIKKVRLTVL
jgi:tetratricopeptide (TPR) repeat protein